jgi:putative ABC transport system substrate-binding protein
LVRLNVDVIVTGGSGATRIGREATSTIPIVMAQDSDPVGDGFIATLARPGENITGLTNVSSEVSGKRLELLRDTIPKLFRVAVLGNSTNPANAQALKETENAAQALGLKLEYLDMQKADDAESVFNAVGKTQSQALLVLQNPIAGIHEHESYSLRQNVDFP